MMVMMAIGKYYNIQICQDRGKVNDNHYNWCTKEKQLSDLPLFIFWEVWKNSNNVLFQNCWIFPMRLIASLIGEFNAWLKPIRMKKRRVLQQPSFPMGWPIGYFDWAVQKG